MRVHTVTGASPKDYIVLEAQSVTECAALVRVAQSKFLPDGAVELIATGSVEPISLLLRIYVGESKTHQMTAETKDALDTER